MGLLKDVTVKIDVAKPSGVVADNSPLLVVEAVGGFSFKQYQGEGAIDDIKADFAETTAAYKIAAALLRQYDRPEKVAIVGYDPTDGTAAQAIADNYNEDFYYVVLETADVAEQIDAAEEVDLRGSKLIVLRANSVEDIELIEAANLKRVHVLYTTEEDEYIDAAFVGAYASLEPGSATAKFKELEGISPVSLTSAEFTQLEGLKASTYVRKFGVPQTTGSKLVGDEYLDVVVGNDWVIATIEQTVQGLYVSNRKIPFDQRGANMIGSAVETVMQQAVIRDIIAQDEEGNGIYTVTIPDVGSLTEAERASRKLKGIKFSYRLAGAVEDVEIVGTVTF